MMPPAQIVSPTHWSIPYFKGMEISDSKASKPPTRTQLIIYFAFVIEFFLIGSIVNLVGKLFASISF